MNEDLVNGLVQVIVAILGVLTIAISGYLAPMIKGWLAARAHEAQAAGHEMEVAVLTELARQAVLAIEQQIDRYTSNGERRVAAVDWLVTQGLSRGIQLNRADATQLVEAAVRTMKATGLTTDKTQSTTITSNDMIAFAGGDGALPGTI